MNGDEEATVLHCTWHPQRETLLRCNRCDRPMCLECAVRHPVGLRCIECTRALRSPLYRVSPAGYLRATIVAIAVGALAAVPAALLSGFLWLLGLLVAGPLGAGVAEAVSIASGRKRGRPLAVIAAGGMILGVVVASLLLSRAVNPWAAVALFRQVGIWLYLLLGISTAAARLS